MNDTLADSPISLPIGQAPELQDLVQQIVQKSVELGYLTLRLHQQGELTHNALTPLCQELWQLEQKLSIQPGQQLEQPLPFVIDPAVAPPPNQDVSATPDPEQSISGSAPDVCSVCSAVILSGKKFCSNCGTPVAAIAPAAAEVVAMPAPAPSEQAPPVAIAAPQPEPTAVPDICPSCQNPLQADAKFCTFCGQPMGGDSSFTPPAAPPITPPPIAAPPIMPPVVEGPITQYCDNCGRGLPADATSCPDCGGTQFSG